MICRNFRPTLVKTFLLNGGLYQIIFRFLLRRCSFLCSNINLRSYPATFNEFWYSCDEAMNSSLSLDI